MNASRGLKRRSAATQVHSRFACDLSKDSMPPDTARGTLHLGHFRCHIDDIPDSGALNLLDELPRRRLVAVLVDQADGEYHRLKLGAEIREIRKKINDHSGSFIKSLNH